MQTSITIILHLKVVIRKVIESKQKLYRKAERQTLRRSRDYVDVTRTCTSLRKLNFTGHKIKKKKLIR